MSSDQRLLSATFWDDLRTDLRPERLVPAVTTGLVTGATEISICAAFATMIFAGDLAPYVSRGIGFMLFGATVHVLLTALFSSLRPAISSVQDNPAAIMALVSVAIAGSSGSVEQKFVTLVAALTLIALATGIILWLLGVFRQGDLGRYIPYPVMGGFLAGVGVLLIQGAISVMAGVNVSPKDLDAFSNSTYLVRWLPGMVAAVVALLVLRRFSHSLLMPVILIGGILLFYLVLLVSGTSIAEAQAGGWLLESFPKSQGGLWQPVSPSAWEGVQWSVLADQVGMFVAIVFISVIALLLNATGYELASQQDGDLNRELKVAGLANMIAGAGGGLVGYLALGPSVLAHRISGRGRLPGVLAALLVVAVLVMGGSLLAYFPKPVLGALLFLLGLDFLVTWLVDARSKMPLIDTLIVILILVVINLMGFLEGIAVGITVAGILFIVNYSRIGVIRRAFSAATYRSSVVRPSVHENALTELGDQIQIFKLQGYLFFGTANRLLEQVRASLCASTHPCSIVFDFQMVSGLDSSAMLSFARLRQFAQANGVILCFSHLAPALHAQLAHKVFLGPDDPVCRTFPDLDHAVEWCENQLLNSLDKMGTLPALHDLRHRLGGQLHSQDHANLLMHYLEHQEVGAQHILTRQGDPPRGLFFIERGLITIQLERKNALPLRLRKMSSGTIVGEMGLYLNQPASATVITEMPSTIYHLSPGALDRLASEHPEVATAFHASMAAFMAERLTQTTRTLRTLVD